MTRHIQTFKGQAALFTQGKLDGLLSDELFNYNCLNEYAAVFTIEPTCRYYEMYLSKFFVGDGVAYVIMSQKFPEPKIMMTSIGKKAAVEAAIEDIYAKTQIKEDNDVSEKELSETFDLSKWMAANDTKPSFDMAGMLGRLLG